MLNVLRVPELSDGKPYRLSGSEGYTAKCTLGRLSLLYHSYLFIYAPWSCTKHNDQGFNLKQTKAQIDNS